MRRRRIAIIGGGVSGVFVAAQLLKRRGGGAPDVVLIERGRRLGAGLAYGGADRAHLLNVRASNMSAFPDAPDDFAHWRGRRARGASPISFAPRRLYGDYVENVLARAARWAWGRLKWVRGEAIACQRAGAGWDIEIAGGKTVAADAVVLAMGNGPGVVPVVFETNGVPVFDAWSAEATRRIPQGGDVLMLGAGLTMIDLALTLTRDKRVGTIYALSRRGLVPRSHLTDATPAPPEALALPSQLSEALHVFRREVRAIVARGEPWQFAIDRLRARTPDLWRNLTEEQQRRFLRHLRVWWDVHRHRAAPQIATRVEALRAAGKLRVLAGEVVSAQCTARGVEVQHRGRGSLARHRLAIARVINCTGSSLDLTNSPDRLVRQLLVDGIARPHACGLGFDGAPDGLVLDSAGAPHASLFALGPLTQGAFWESTAVPEIRVRAAALAERLAAPAQT